MIKVGIVGVGHLGEIHLKLILSSIDFDLIGFYDTDFEKADLISKKYQVKFFNNLNDLSENILAVIICTPTIYHHEIASFFLKNNINLRYSIFYQYLKRFLNIYNLKDYLLFCQE